MHAALTYESFPHIVDGVLAHVDRATALTLRLTCHSLQRAVDRRHAAFLVLTPDGKDGAAVRGPVHRVAALQRLGPESWAQGPAHPSLKVTEHTRVLDIRGHFPATCNLTLLKKAFPSLRTLRICTRKGAYTPYVPIGAQTLVIFTSPHGGDCNPKEYASARRGDLDQLMDTFSGMFGELEENEAPVLPSGVKHRALPKSFRKIIVNMNGEDYAIAEMFHCVLDPPEHIQEIVIVLPRYELSAFVGGFGHVSAETLAIKIIAMDLAELMVGVPHVRYTLVGLESAGRTKTAFLLLLRKQFEKYRFGDVKYADEPELVTKPDGTYDLERKCKEPKKHKAKIDGIMDQLTVLSFKEYVQLVGKARAVEELVEYADGTGRDVRPRGILLNDIRRMGPAAQEE